MNKKERIAQYKFQKGWSADPAMKQKMKEARIAAKFKKIQKTEKMFGQKSIGGTKLDELFSERKKDHIRVIYAVRPRRTPTYKKVLAKKSVPGLFLGPGGGKAAGFVIPTRAAIR